MTSWKVSLPCTRAEAEALKEDIAAFAMLDAPPVLVTTEIDPARPDEWRLDAYFEAKPGRNALSVLAALAPSSGTKPEAERVADEDWVTLSQQGLEPIRAGRFFVHTPVHRDAIPPGAIALEIDAGLAFGTGHHETTTGCLMMLDRLRSAGARFSNILDLGTGTGLLAFAALRLWPTARGAASDIDPVSIDVARDNAAVNGIRIGTGAGRVELAVAPGLRHRRLQARGPYDLIIANILAGPLIDLAPEVASALRPGGNLLLAGLLHSQAEAVASAYRAEGLRLAARLDRGEWPTLRMVRRRQPSHAHRPASRA